MSQEDEIQQMRDEVEARKQEEAENLPPPAEEKPPEELSDKFILDCLWANELGDGILYAEVNRGKFIFSKASKEWYAWAGHHWSEDIMDLSEVEIERGVDQYQKVLDKYRKKATKEKNKNGKSEKFEKLADTIKALSARIKRLRSTNGASNCLTKAHKNPKPLATPGDKFDLKPWLLACPNGVIDLETGKFGEGHQEQLLTKHCPTEWQGKDADWSDWHSTLLSIFKDDEEMVGYIQRLLGYSITGQISEHIFPVFSGQGRNGKGVIIETLSSVLGEIVGPIPAAMLLDQGRVQNSSGASADIMSLRGLRMAFASETDEGRRFSPAGVKWLTGDDTLVGRPPFGKKLIFFKPTHTLFLQTNHRPHTSLSDDFAFWERMHLILFELSFVNRKPKEDNERQADPGLKKKLWKNKPAILAWLVQGCLEWQRQGLNPPQSVEDATLEYRKSENFLDGFLEDCCVEGDPGLIRCKAAEIFDRYVAWNKENNGENAWTATSVKFGTLMGKKFERKKSSGINHYLGVGLLAKGEG